MNLEERLQALADRAEIANLLGRYAHAIDRRDVDAVAACFTEDARYHGSLGDGGLDLVLGVLRERMDRYETTTHLTGSQTIELDGDRAHSEGYALVYHRLRAADDEQRADFIVCLRYIDDLVRTPAGWRICARRAQIEWERTDPVLPPPA